MGWILVRGILEASRCDQLCHIYRATTRLWFAWLAAEPRQRNQQSSQWRPQWDDAMCYRRMWRWGRTYTHVDRCNQPRERVHTRTPSNSMRTFKSVAVGAIDFTGDCLFNYSAASLHHRGGGVWGGGGGLTIRLTQSHRRGSISQTGNSPEGRSTNTINKHANTHTCEKPYKVTNWQSEIRWNCINLAGCTGKKNRHGWTGQHTHTSTHI